MPLKLAPQPEDSKPDQLAGLLAKLHRMADDALSGNIQDEGHVDDVTKLVNAVARLTEARVRVERSVAPSDLARLMLSMAQSVSAHVPDVRARSAIEADWRDLARDIG